MHRPVDGLGRSAEVGEAVVVRVRRCRPDDHVLEIVQPVADGGQLSQVVPLADRGHDDEGAGPALAQDEADFLGAVEVHDGHQRHAEHGTGVEGDRRLNPVGELEEHDVARSDAEGPQTHRPRATPPGRRSPTVPLVRIEVGRPDADAAPRVLAQRASRRKELAERAVVPCAFGEVMGRQLLRHGPERSNSSRCAHHVPPILP